MTIYFSEVFRKLRHERELTQEQAADIFNVSPQAVSRWECGSTTPDITLLPTIAEYFNITLEELLGVEKSHKEAKIQDYLDKFENAIQHGYISDCIQIARDGVQEFPTNYTLLNNLMYALFVSTSDDANIKNWKDNMNKYSNEIIALGEKILQGCLDDDIRTQAKSRLGFHYCDIGEIDKGRAIFETLPSITSCREYNIYQALEGEERLKHICRQTVVYTYQLAWNIWRFAMRTDSTARERLHYMDKIEAIVRIICDEDDLGDWYYLLPRLYIVGKCPLYLELGDTDTALGLIEKCAEYLEHYYAIPTDSPRTSPLLRYLIFDDSGHTADSRSHARIIYEDDLSKDCYRQLKDNERFIRARERIKAMK